MNVNGKARSCLNNPGKLHVLLLLLSSGEFNVVQQVWLKLHIYQSVVTRR